MKILTHTPKASIIFSIALMLAGCPGIGDRYRPPETTTVSATPDALCFQVPDAEDYQPTFIIISSPETPLKDRKYIDKPELTVSNGQMCIPFSFYPFPEKGQLIVDYILSSKKKSERPRNVIVEIELTRGVIARTISLKKS